MQLKEEQRIKTGIRIKWKDEKNPKRSGRKRITKPFRI
jgi:hypothetical protein